MGLSGLAAIGSGAVSGALTGASFGGPWGAAIGGVAGGALGGVGALFSNRAEEEEKKKRIEEQRASMQAQIERQYANDVSGMTHGMRLPMYELDAQQGAQAAQDANADQPFDPSQLMPIVQGGAQLAGKLYGQATNPSLNVNKDRDGFQYDPEQLKKLTDEEESKRRLSSASAANPWSPYR